MSPSEDERVERRLLKERALRRRRLTAIGMLLAAVVVVVVVVVGASGGSSGNGSGSARETGSKEASGRAKAGKRTRPAGSPAQAREARAAAVNPNAPVTRRTAVPILFYHEVTTPPPGAPLPELYVSAEDFAAQMQALKQAGYHAVTQDQMFASWHGGPPLPPKPIVISFDDGYVSWNQNAWPVLRRMGWPGVVNIQVELMGTGPRAPVKKAEVRKFLAAGWEVDSHTLTHPDLTTVDAAQLKQEVAGARRELQQRLGVPVNFFCYPGGRFDATVEAAVKSAGYRGATTTNGGLATPNQPYTLPRVRVNGGESASAVLESVRSSETSGTPAGE
jgi:peptidoglycan/xylan/chitin deacetylase (PgdA/CDA1 family)